MPSRPATTDEVTAGYVTDALRQGGVIDGDTAVAEVAHHPIGEGVGIVGQLARLTLRWEGTAEGAPSSLIVKMPSQYPENRAIGEHFNFYEREARFYQQIGDKSPLRTPRCFHNHIDVDRREFLLLLEDLGDRTLISQIAGMGATRTGAALDALARLHAEWWDSPTLDSLNWMPRLVDPVNLSAGEQYRLAWPAYLERFGDQLPEGAVAIGERVKDVWEQLVVETDARWPSTLCHGDFRADNLMFDDDAEGRERVAVLDWQIANRGPAMSDVSYLLTQSIEPEDRRAADRELVERWFDTVCATRGTAPHGLTFDDVWRDYRVGTLTCTVYPVVSGGTMDLANERGRQLAEVMSHRAFTAAIELDAADLLP
jgi:hypothetical protein